MRVERIIYISKDRNDQLHCHGQFHELHLGISGSAEFLSGLTRASFEAGSLAYVPPGRPHQLRPRPRMDFLYILFEPEVQDSVLLERLNATPARCPVKRIPDFSSNRLHRMHAGFLSDDACARAGAHHLFSAILYEAATTLQAGGDSPAAIERVLQLMHRSLGEPLPVNALAAEAGMAVSSFIRAFERQTGYTPHVFLNRLRCDHACYLLNHTDKALKEIADDLGFCSPNHFSRIFRQTLGQPPGAYRREMLTVS